MSIEDILQKIISEKLDKVNKDAVMKKFAKRKDQDIDNDGEVDDEDKYLHTKRKAITKAMKKEDVERIDEEKNLSAMEKQALKSALGFGGAADPKYKKVIEKLKRMGYVKDIELQKGIISPEQDTYYYNLTPKGKKIAMMKEDYDLQESHFEVGDEVECIKSGMEGEVVKVDPKEKGKYYTVKREDGKMMKYAPDELKALSEDVQLDEADGWIAMYNGKKLEITKNDAKDLYGAKMYAAKELKVPKSKMGVLAVKPAYNESVKFNGRTFKDYKVFNSEREANKFLEKNDDYGVIGEKGKKVYVAKMDDMGESID